MFIEHRPTLRVFEIGFRAETISGNGSSIVLWRRQGPDATHGVPLGSSGGDNRLWTEINEPWFFLSQRLICGAASRNERFSACVNSVFLRTVKVVPKSRNVRYCRGLSPITITVHDFAYFYSSVHRVQASTSSTHTLIRLKTKRFWACPRRWSIVRATIIGSRWRGTLNTTDRPTVSTLDSRFASVRNSEIKIKPFRVVAFHTVWESKQTIARSYPFDTCDNLVYGSGLR